MWVSIASTGHSTPANKDSKQSYVKEKDAVAAVSSPPSTTGSLVTASA
ncbi:hypothetical protein Hdeb2414_s0006g00207971 [Helianthus debilis subsp. tardiflorus]